MKTCPIIGGKKMRTGKRKKITTIGRSPEEKVKGQGEAIILL